MLLAISNAQISGTMASLATSSLETGGCKGYPRMDRPENTTKSRQRRRGRMPPSVAMSFVEEATCDGLSEREAMLLSKFEHAAYCFLPFRLASCRSERAHV